jgi:hypothetical protein
LDSKVSYVYRTFPKSWKMLLAAFWEPAEAQQFVDQLSRSSLFVLRVNATMQSQYLLGQQPERRKRDIENIEVAGFLAQSTVQ